MADRFSRLFSLPENLYATDSPVVIAAGALLKDNQTGKVLAQLKFRNISEKRIKALKIKIRPLDTVNNPLGDETEYQYLDLNISRDEDFGQKNGITLADAATRAYSPEVTEVDFEDNSVWLSSGDTWDPIPDHQEIGDKELTKQYRMQYGESAQYKPIRFKDLWICTCGAVNKNTQSKCYRCSNEIERLLACDWEELTAAKDQRLAEEKAQREAEIAADKAAKEAAAKRRNKTLTIAISALAICIGTWMLLSKVVIPNARYNKAVKYAEAGQYQEAIVAFQSLGDYKDSSTQIEKARKALIEAENAAKYERGILLLSNGDFDGAINIFTQLGYYQDSAKKLKEAQDAKTEAEDATAYEKAIALLTTGEYDKAIDAFTKLGNYQDSAKKLEEAQKAKKEAENDAAYKNAVALRDAKDYDAAIAAFSALGDYKDSTEQANEAKYLLAKSLLSYGKNVNYDNIAKSRDLFIELGNYKDSKEYLQHFSLKIIAEFSQTNLVFYNEYGDRLFEGYNAKSQNGNLIIDCDSYTFTYDENGRLVKYDRHWKNAPDDTVYFNYKFSSDGRISIVQTREKKSKPWKTAMKYRYDNQGRVSTVEFFREQYIDPKMQLIRSKAEYEYDGKKLVSIKYYGYYNGWKEYHSYTDTEIKFEYDSNGKLVYLIYKNSPANNNNVSGQSYYYGYVYAPKARDLFMPIESPISLVPFYY